MANKEKNKEIISRLKQNIEKSEQIIINGGDLSDIGNLIGIAIGPYVDEDSLGYDLEDIFHGIQHGIEQAK